MADSAGYPNVVAGRSSSDHTPTDILMDPTSFALYMGAWVWNTTTLGWEKMTQPTAATQGDLSAYWKDKRFDYASGDLDYKGLATTHKASTAAGDLWEIWKYTYLAGSWVRMEGPLTGNWDDRSSLAWA